MGFAEVDVERALARPSFMTAVTTGTWESILRAHLV